MVEVRSVGSLGPASAVSGPPLVLYGQRSGETTETGCPDRVRGARLRAPDGSWLPLNCGKRSCPYCGRLKDYELLQCLLIDAREQLASTIITTTTVHPFRPGFSHQPNRDPCRCPGCLAGTYREASAQMWRALRDSFGRIEYLASMEFTTGEHAKDGQRRMHGHHLVKWLDPCHCASATKLARGVWERVTGAWNVEVAPLRSAGGIAGYLALHHRKRDQLPPPEWRGMTVRASKGYWSRPIATIREEAKREQAIRRSQWKMLQEGATLDQAAALAPLEVDHQRAQWAEHTAEVVPVRELPTTAMPVRPR